MKVIEITRNAVRLCSGIALGLAGLNIMLTGLMAQPDQYSKDIRWVTESIEYAALCKQTYNMAWPVVKEAARKSAQPWVVVFDIDETVLDNSAYQIQRAAMDSGFTSASWQEWVLMEQARPVAGVKAILDSIRALGSEGHIAFLSNRMARNDAATIANLRKYDLYHDSDILLTRRDRSDSKPVRRREIESGTGRCSDIGALKIIALFGDNIRDFIEMRGEKTAKEYKSRALNRDERWGIRFFVLPNPMYGSWESGYR